MRAWPQEEPESPLGGTPASIDQAAGTDLIAPLVLLQLSDLHFGSHSRFAGSDLERLATQCREALDEARSDLGWREAVGLARASPLEDPP